MSQIAKRSSGGGGGAVDSVTGIGNIVASPTTGNVIVSNTGFQVIRGPTVDMKSIAITNIFTPTSDFFVVGIILYGINVTGVITISEIFNIGWTAPNYDDLLFLTSSNISTTGSYIQIYSLATTTNILPSSTPLKINVTQAVTTTGNDSQRIDVWGYYL